MFSKLLRWLAACPFLALMLLSGGCEPAEAPPAAPPAEVVVSVPMTQEVTDALEFTGTTEAEESVEVRARVTGFLEQVHFKPRDKVSKDGVLFTIDSRSFQNSVDSAKADLEAKQAQLTKKEFDVAKIEGLFKTGAANEDERVTAIADRDALRAAIAAGEAVLSEARLQLEWCRVTAPIDGHVSREMIDRGNIVRADTTLLTKIVRDDSIYAYFNASERDILALRQRAREERAAAGGEAARQPEFKELDIQAWLGLMTEEGYPHKGVIDYASPEIDQSTGTLQVRAVFNNDSRVLLPGLFVRVRVPIGKPYRALMVTERALGSDQGQRFVYVVNSQNIVEYRPVQVGTLTSGMRVIAKGIAPEDRVIVNGLQRVRPGVTAKPVEAPMPTGPAVAPAPTTAPASSGDAG